MELTASKKFNRFISEKRDDVCKILNKRLGYPLAKSKMDEIFQNSAIILYEKINSGNLKMLRCKVKIDGIDSEIELPVLADEANHTLLSYLVEICYRQTLKYNAKKHNNKGDLTKKYKENIKIMATESGMSESEFTDMLGGYSGFMNGESQFREIEMDGEISNEQYMEILNMCSEADNSIYKEIVSQALDALATRCRELLSSYYAHKRMTWSDIASRFGIQGGANSAKVSAGRCRERLTQRCHEIEREQYGR